MFLCFLGFVVLWLWGLGVLGFWELGLWLCLEAFLLKPVTSTEGERACGGVFAEGVLGFRAKGYAFKPNNSLAEVDNMCIDSLKRNPAFHTRQRENGHFG